MNMKRGSSGGEQVRRRRDPAATREAILAAARIVLAADGRDALSLTKVAHVAGVNRGTAYQHFKTRDELVKATVAWVSQHLADTLFGAQDDSGIVPDAMQRPVYEVISALKERGAEMLIISNNQDALAQGKIGLAIPSIPEECSPMVAGVVGQMIALHVALEKGLDPDQPRGLNKVTLTV